MDTMNFNVDHGYLEGIIRGFKSGILKESEYLNLAQCETLDGTYTSHKKQTHVHC